jgi:hypothetical protein
MQIAEQVELGISASYFQEMPNLNVSHDTDCVIPVVLSVFQV